MDKCEQLAETLHGYIDNELSREEAKAVENHLTACLVCRKRVEIFRGLKTTLKEKLVPVPAPGSLTERILKREIRPVPAYPVFSFPRLAYALIILLVISAGTIFYRQSVKPAHFLVLQTAVRIQKHLDNCPGCQKGSVKILEEHIKTASTKKIQQKHLEDCPDCEKKIVRRIEHCIKAMAWNVREKVFETLPYSPA